MQCISRSRCAITGADDLEHLHTFKQFPVFMGCTDRGPSSDIAEDMCWWISKSSGLIQLNPLLPLDVLYPESHGAGAVGALWARHHREFANFIHDLKPTKVFEIGGAHGILEKSYQTHGAIPWTILDPNPAPADGCKAEFIRGFFDGQFVHEADFDTLVHSHVFEHIYAPHEFMKKIAGFVQPGKTLAFALPNMEVMLERKYTNCINFEHVFLLTEPYVEYLLACHGFRIERKQYFLDDHSIFYAAVRDDTAQPIALAPHLYRKNAALYRAYVDFHVALIAEINEKIAAIQGDVYLFGAHVFAQYMLAFGLHATRIKGLLDNDENKQGKRLYGTSLTVHSPEVLRGLPEPTVILRAGVYNTEIKDAIVSRINPHTVFLE
jgi:SAM-dependent methyltransferase